MLNNGGLWLIIYLIYFQFFFFRYLAIFYPKTSRLTPQIAYVTIAFIWIVPMCIFIPWPIVYTQRSMVLYPQTPPYVTCMPMWNNVVIEKGYFLGVVFLSCYLLPLIFIAIFYLLIGIRVWKRRVAGMRGTRAERNIHRSKIRIVCMLLVVFIIFVLSWLPLYSLQLRNYFGGPYGSQEKVIFRRYLMPLAQWLGAANSCVNPFIYCYFSANFRKSIVAVLKSRSCCGRITLW